MNNIRTSIRSSALLVLLASQLTGDVLELKNGTVVNGRYVGGTAGTVRFETSTGVQVYETANIIALTFTTGTTQAPASAAPATAPTSGASAAAPAPTASTSVTLPAGTTLLVRLTQAVSSKNDPGTPFTTKLEYDLAVNGKTAVKGGTVIYGKVQSSTQARRATGRSTLDLRLSQMVINGQPVPLVTSGYQEAGQASIAKAAKGAAAGAAIGAIADGSDGAGTGAAIGATAGAMRRGQTVTIPPNTLIEFTLQQPATIPAAQ
jgi:hypothetical protein